MTVHVFFNRDEINAFIKVLKEGALEGFCKTVFLETTKEHVCEDGKEFVGVFILYEYVEPRVFTYKLGLEIGKRLPSAVVNQYPWETKN